MNILSASPALGIVWASLLFILCFLFVHIAKLASLGWKYRKTQNTPEKPTAPAPAPEKKAPAEEKPQEPVYYIVEKKRRAKTTFSEPKQIRFK